MARHQETESLSKATISLLEAARACAPRFGVQSFRGQPSRTGGICESSNRAIRLPRVIHRGISSHHHFRSNILRSSHQSHTDKRDDHVGNDCRRRKLQTSCDAGSTGAHETSAGVLPCGGRRETHQRLRNPFRGLASGVRLERKIRTGWQWRICRHDPVRGHGRTAASWIRHSRHGRWTRQRPGPNVGDRASGESRRLRLSRRARNRGSSKSHLARVLRQGCPPQLFRRLLGGRA